MLQEEKQRIESEARIRENSQIRKNEDLKAEVQRLHAILSGADRDLKDRSGDLSTKKAIAENRNVDITRLRKLVADLDEEGIRIQRTKTALQQELRAAYEDKRIAEQGANRCADDREQLKRVKDNEEDRLHSANVELDKLNRQLNALKIDVEAAEKQCSQKESDVLSMNQLKKNAQTEVEMLSVKNRRLLDDKDALIKKIKDLELQSRLAERKLDDVTVLINAKDKEIKTIKSNSEYAESKEMATRQDLRKTQTENDTLQQLLNQYRNDAQLHKRLRDEESLQKIRLEEEKKRLSQEALRKSIEAQTAKKELERYENSHSQLLQERVMVSQELDAIKDHANLLESQNFALNRELDTFVDTNEKARMDLNRRDRVNYIKGRNQEEIQRSTEKVRKSRSPERSPYRSPYKSPVRSQY